VRRHRHGNRAKDRIGSDFSFTFMAHSGAGRKPSSDRFAHQAWVHNPERNANPLSEQPTRSLAKKAFLWDGMRRSEHEPIKVPTPCSTPARETCLMNVPAVATLSFLLLVISSGARPADRMRFWNLTGVTIAKLYLAQSGTTKWGPNQCANDKDGTVEPDERLNLTGVTAGKYAIKLTDTSGRTCIVKDVTLEAGKAYAFSLSDADLKDCSE
jgi:hypothetical protein